ncbi:hypothetical protein HK097_009258 [Rhizophlyctis rosea]|uniref:Uncharacterized protein n=1 Tax=Rhizophlyctis rosea TaxID=64517 RepID=A0AAD5X9E4_9FUNG|nr:hypothetical protein HK097_009258 [Rhizophlyctis rosea]
MSHRSFAANTNRVAAPRRPNPAQTTSSEPDVDSSSADVIQLNRSAILTITNEPSSAKDASTTLSSTCSKAVATLADLESLALNQLHANYITDFRLAQQQRLQEAQEAYLKAKLDAEIAQKAKVVRGKYFGWEGTNGQWCERTERRVVGDAFGMDALAGQNMLGSKWDWEQETSDDKWRLLKDVEAHRFLLEDPEVKERFFDDLDKLWLRDDVRGLPGMDETHILGKTALVQRKTCWDVGEIVHAPSVSKPKRLIVRGPPTLHTMRKTTARKRLEEDLAKQENEIREALQKKFKANSVPAASIMPRYVLYIYTSNLHIPRLKTKVGVGRYARIMQQMGTKSAAIRAQRAAELTAQVQPFKILVDDERTREACRCRSKLNANIQTALEEIDHVKSAKDRMKRRIEASACLEPRLVATAAEEGRRRREKLKENESKAGLTVEHTFHPVINHEIPDYEDQYRRFKFDLAMRKEMKAVTMPQPFPGVEEHTKEGSRLSKLRKRSKSVERPMGAPKWWTRRRVASISAHPLPRPRPTHAFLLKVQQRELEREAAELIENVKHAELAKKKAERKLIAAKMRSTLHLEMPDKRQGNATSMTASELHKTDDKAPPLPS